MAARHLNHADGVSDVSYWVVPSSRGRGVATAAALGALAEWAFDVLGLHRIFVDHSTRNLASCAVATRAGFRLEGTKREDALHADGWHDMHLHARLAVDVAPAGEPGGGRWGRTSLREATGRHHNGARATGTE